MTIWYNFVCLGNAADFAIRYQGIGQKAENYVPYIDRPLPIPPPKVCLFLSLNLQSSMIMRGNCFASVLVWSFELIFNVCYLLYLSLWFLISWSRMQIEFFYKSSSYNKCLVIIMKTLASTKYVYYIKIV